ncbi:MAG: D-glycerate dehydrogenase [Candidatus Cloacimonadaceae bacterium]|jgi:glyoxylate reductase|nr:D-glycerate dehydrogenase [Candidatus Cloacimonadaceae bacterium]
MSGIVFFKTQSLHATKKFYLNKLGLKLWLDQGECHIYAHDDMLIGFCKAEYSSTQGTITFLYDSQTLVDKAYTQFKDISTTAPKLNPKFRIYHFWGKDHENRTLEFQYFLKPDEDIEYRNPIEILNPTSNKPKLLLTRMLPQNAVDILQKTFEVHANLAQRALLHNELIDNIADKHALLCLLNDRIDASVIEPAKCLKVISNYAVGYNNIDLEVAKNYGIAVCNTPGVLTESTADLAWALIMATSRRTVESDVFTRCGKFTGWEPLLFLGQDVHHRTLGILGMGRIGKAVAQRAVGFGMRIIYSGPSEKALDFEAEYVDFNTLLKESDILSLHLPLTDRTKHLISENELKQMKPSAILINTARGAIIDEKMLIHALREKWIFAAGLDVYEHEPEIPSELALLSNVVLLPHIGSASLDTRQKMGTLAAENAIAIITGKDAPARVI